ncbi:MAG TPA: hypothetical protein VGX70_13870 [Gemmataceae bacterium]|jgi:hypothetical protein|nr:hypothetical protein [Gemmataceae bacterium]
MRSLLLVLTLMILAIPNQSALGRSPRAKSTATAAPALPPFPWTAILESIAPVLAIWLGAVVIRRTRAKEISSPPLSARDVASLPVAWYAAMNGFFEKRPTPQKPESLTTPDADETRLAGVTSDFSTPVAHAPGSPEF